jgi:large subunit ribosomal protein L21
MNHAIIETGGMQFPVTEGNSIDVPRLDGAVGDPVVFDRVLYAAKGNDRLVGTPTVPDAKIEGEIIAQERTEKITVFRFKRRTKYRRKTGHRQQYTRVKITGMTL